VDKKVIRLKESYSKFFYTTVNGWLEESLSRPDAFGRTGFDAFKEHDIKIVHGNEKADVGFAKGIQKVSGVSRDKCIMWKGEPPIYNIFFGLNLCNPNFLKEHLAVMSYYELDGLDQIHSNSIQNGFSFVKEQFNVEKNKFLCTVLRNKSLSTQLNFFVFPKYRKNSLMEFREDMDREFANTLGPELYSSYGRGWDERCFKGFLPEWNDKYRVFGEHKFTFAPENSRFNGYVTDKVFNAMCCGSVPIYLGAPDVKKYLPRYTYINAESYTPKELIENLKTMPFSTYNKHRVAMKKFVTSEQSNMYSSYCFAEKIAKIVEERL